MAQPQHLGVKAEHLKWLTSLPSQGSRALTWEGFFVQPNHEKFQQIKNYVCFSLSSFLDGNFFNSVLKQFLLKRKLWRRVPTRHGDLWQPGWFTATEWPKHCIVSWLALDWLISRLKFVRRDAKECLFEYCGLLVDLFCLNGSKVNRNCYCSNLLVSWWSCSAICFSNTWST